MRIFIFDFLLFFLVITGQNPASAHEFGVAILNALNKK
jgi:putative intracellular protease/amidase